ncbi:4a-hydroxytetrahydrobiopterin dehydratase, partial [[Kitasatospora] papulosa]|uniref:4a-hydroxytetrahydrobiopterin dehydratase n=1 Tax=[Kitasatospora] papulosa TaxID=1464011 RepID=UPI0036B5322E
MPTEPLSAHDVEAGLGELPGWQLEGDRITRTYRLPSHFAAAGLTVHVAQIQDELNHHSDLTQLDLLVADAEKYLADSPA